MNPGFHPATDALNVNLNKMRGILNAAITLFAVLVMGCGRNADYHWKDGNFTVYALGTDFDSTKLGYDHHPGLLGLVNAEVVAAGSNAEVVFVERHRGPSKLVEFYLVPKNSTDGRQPGMVEGPFSQAEFEKIRVDRRLPKFTWHKRKNG